MVDAQFFYLRSTYKWYSNKKKAAGARKHMVWEVASRQRGSDSRINPRYFERGSKNDSWNIHA